MKKLSKTDLSTDSYFYVVVLILYLVVAYNSSGYYHFDEHFQVIEFANYKMGNTSSSDLAWEFSSRLRSSFQPALCFTVFKICNSIGLDDSYQLSFILRALTAVFSISAIRFFIQSFKHAVINDYRNLFVLMSYFIWFLPYINVRFSSETCSGVCFVFALGLIGRPNPRRTNFQGICLGIVLGISILFRYQTAIMVCGAILWLIVFEGESKKRLAVIIFSIIAVLSTGVVIDIWFYGDFNLTIYNYVYINLIKDVASQFGASPWYEILYYIFFSTGPLGILISIAYLIMVFYEPKSVFIWTTLPFLVVHSIVPHKELRFLFPLANLVPIILILGFQHFSRLKLLPPRGIGLALLILFITINSIGLGATVFRGAGDAKVAVGEYIHKKYAQQKINLICVNGINPYIDWQSPKDTFYLHSNISRIIVPTIWGPDPFNQQLGDVTLLLIRQEDITGPRTLALLENNGFTLVFENFNAFERIITEFYDSSFFDQEIFVYELQKN
ncbi:glycosyltransferase family protein [Pedobacter endophyticus]|uniref:hypothetical protein n=1 Tax=Pedobacter endophyticus TaxID=2789740 RepID=UPI001E4428BC|nr:hypothetical protein [Pedobacter endophyticus]